MNLSKLGFSSWIIILNIVLLLILVLQLYRGRKEYYMNYPQQIDPMGPVTTNTDATNANNGYVSILTYIKKNPQKSANFIEDIKSKFFDKSCTVRNDIDFNKITTFTNGVMPF